MQKAPGRRLLYIDAIRAYAILLVIIIHVSSDVVLNRASAIDRTWWIANAWNSFARSSVPLFVMISGALLLDPIRQERISVFFRKRAAKVFLPVLAWLPLFLWWGRNDMAPVTARKVAEAIIGGTVYYHLWFVYMLLGLYLATPVLRIYVRYAERRNLRYFLYVWFIASSILPTVTDLLHFDLGVNFYVMTDFVGYYVAGYYLRDVRVSRTLRRWLPVIIIAATGVTMIGTYLVSAHAGVLNEACYDHFRPNIVLMSLATYLWLRDIDYAALCQHWPRLYRTMQRVSATSFSVYLIHVLIIELLADPIKLNALTISPLFGIPVTTTVTLALSVLITLAMRKIPWICRLFP